MDLQALRKSLLEQVEEAFPAETDAYRDIRNQSTQVSLEIGVVPVVLSVPSAFTGWLFQLEGFFGNSKLEICLHLFYSQESRRALQASNLLSNGDLKVKSEH